MERDENLHLKKNQIKFRKESRRKTKELSQDIKKRVELESYY